MFKYLKICFYLILAVLIVFMISTVQAQLEMKTSTPFEKRLEPLNTPDETNQIKSNPPNQNKAIDTVYIDKETQTKSYIYKPKDAFKLVVTKDEVPNILPDKGVYGVISLRITPDYMSTSRVIYARSPYKFDRLNWAIKTGWNDTIPFFSRLVNFRKYLKPFDEPVYAHFYIMGVQEYPEYPGQYYHWPREALEDYYLYILEKIDAVSSQY